MKSPSSLLLQSTIYNLSHDQSIYQFLQSTRRHLHQNPELLYQESRTSNYIQTILTMMNVTYTTGWAINTNPSIQGKGGYGIVATIGQKNPLMPCIILRADMDALPINEQTNLPFHSNNSNMHACGHDGHVTMLLGATYILKYLENYGLLNEYGTIRIVFQPAEETGAGMKRMIQEGLLDMVPKAQIGYGIHVWPMLESHVIASREGPLLAATDLFCVIINGEGGHAAMPDQTKDPIMTSATIITQVQSIVSRLLSPLTEGVISFTSVHSGEGYNVIPSLSELKGTMRALSSEKLEFLKEKFDKIVYNIGDSYNVKILINHSQDYYPPTINHKGLYTFSKQIGSMVSKEGKMIENIEPTMGGEDFAFLAQELPCTFFLLGQGGSFHSPNNKLSTNYGLHHPKFTLDERVLPQGVELHLNLAFRTLKMLKERKKSGVGVEL